MKATLLYKAALTLFLIPTLVLGSNNENWNGKYTKEKTVKKEFTVNRDALLKVDNSYGNIDIMTYDGNTVTIEVHIKTNGNNEEKVQKKLDDIHIEFNGSSSMVEARTKFSKGSSSWWNWGKNNNVNMEVNYVINLPITNSVDLSNDYGSINLDKLEGKATISCDYGKITTKELMADNNILRFDYTNNSYFEYIKSGKINADYSGYTVGKAKDLQINADYTKSEVEVVEDVNYNCDYGSIHIEKANNVTGNGDYLTARLGDIYKNVSLRADYGSIEVKQMTANAGNLDIVSDYAGITIGYNSSYNFNFEIDLEYASLRNKDELEISKQIIESSDKHYEGYYGNANSGNLIKIKSEYGSVSLKKIN